MKRIIPFIFPLFISAQQSWQLPFSTVQSWSQLGIKGDTSHFAIDTSGYLRLNAPSSTGIRSLNIASEIRTNAQWQLSLQLQFNPSSSNFAKVYLWADAESESNIENGVFLRIGGTTEDRLSLIALADGQEQIITESAANFLDKNEVDIGIRVELDQFQEYTLYVDTIHWKGGQFYELGRGTFVNQIPSSHFIISCRHTSTRRDRFLFDEISVSGDVFADLDAPLLLYTFRPSSRKLKLNFSEHLDSIEIDDPHYFQLYPGGIGPTDIQYDSKKKEVALSFDFLPFDTVPFHLHLNGISDLAENRLDTTLENIWLYAARPGDLLINELMIDPEPMVGLPQSEALELYNASAYPLNLHNWTIQSGGDIIQLDSISVDGNEYLWITGRMQDCPPEIHCQEVDWPTHFLPNSSGSVGIIDEHGIIRDGVNYTDDDYQHELKSQGGWTLERRYASLPCLGMDEWAASQSTSGGSPGRINSISTIDGRPFPALAMTEYSFIHPMQLRLFFNMHVYCKSTVTQAWTGIPMDSVYYGNAQGKFVDLFLSERLQADSVYSVGLPACLVNCEEVALEDDLIVQIRLPSPQEHSSWQITELMFDPEGGCPEWIEISLEEGSAEIHGLRMCKMDESNNLVCSDPFQDRRVVHSGQFLVLTEDIEEFISCFHKKIDFGLMEVPDFITLNNDGGQIILIDSALRVLAEASYSPDDHSSLLWEGKGRSLCRRISENKLTNWHSSEPNGRPGSACNHVDGNQNKSGIGVNIVRSCMSPNGDGHQDELLIDIFSKDQESLIFAEVLSLEGIPLVKLLEHAFLYGSKQFQWDGRMANGSRLSVGTYLLRVDVEMANGDVNKVIRPFSVCR